MMPTKGLFGSGGKFGLSGSRAEDFFTKGIGKLTEKEREEGLAKGKWSLADLLKMGIPLAVAVEWLQRKIGPAEDIRIDPIDEPITDYRMANFQSPVTRDTGYASALMADGGIMNLQDGGFSQGPGTGTSDSIPAMLSDGEFVMTADAVRGAGGGNRREGARRMYEMMDGLEARA